MLLHGSLNIHDLLPPLCVGLTSLGTKLNRQCIFTLTWFILTKNWLKQGHWEPCLFVGGFCTKMEFKERATAPQKVLKLISIVQLVLIKPKMRKAIETFGGH